jgi:hypothetical protein
MIASNADEVKASAAASATTGAALRVDGSACRCRHSLKQPRHLQRLGALLAMAMAKPIPAVIMVASR